MILVLEIRLLHTSVLELSAATFGGRNAPIELGRWRFPLFGLILAWTLVTVALPIAVLFVQSASLSAFADAFSRASDSILRSVVFAAIGATLLTLLGFFCGYLVHSRALCPCGEAWTHWRCSCLPCPEPSSALVSSGRSVSRKNSADSA
jgi:ABC-type Fe3+ transport system permease subunit